MEAIVRVEHSMYVSFIALSLHYWKTDFFGLIYWSVYQLSEYLCVGKDFKPHDHSKIGQMSKEEVQWDLQRHDIVVEKVLFFLKNLLKSHLKMHRYPDSFTIKLFQVWLYTNHDLKALQMTEGSRLPTNVCRLFRGSVTISSQSKCIIQALSWSHSHQNILFISSLF